MHFDRLLVAAIAVLASRAAAQGSAKFTAPPPQPSERSAPAVRQVRAEALPSKVDYVPQGRYDELRNYVVRSRTTGGTLFNSPDGQTNYMMVLRSTASDVEEHSRWDDLII